MQMMMQLMMKVIQHIQNWNIIHLNEEEKW